MRTYYVFKIKKHYATLTKERPYQIYKTIEDMYYLNEKELLSRNNMFIQIYEKFNLNKLNEVIYNECKDSYTYTKYNNTHIINNYFNSESSKLIITQSFLKIKSTKEIPSFFEILSKKNNLFVCDFINKDYFWLTNI